MPNGDGDDRDRLAELVGKIWIDFMGLETLIRLVLSDDNRVDFPSEPEVGEQVRESVFTDYSTFGQLLDAYREEIGAERGKYRLENADDLLLLRNALAHGHAMTEVEGEPLTLVKFDSDCRVEYAAEMTEDWAQRQIDMVTDAMRTVHTCRREREENS